MNNDFSAFSTVNHHSKCIVINDKYAKECNVVNTRKREQCRIDIPDMPNKIQNRISYYKIRTKKNRLTSSQWQFIKERSKDNNYYYALLLRLKGLPNGRVQNKTLLLPSVIIAIDHRFVLDDWQTFVEKMDKKSL